MISLNLLQFVVMWSPRIFIILSSQFIFIILLSCMILILCLVPIFLSSLAEQVCFLQDQTILGMPIAILGSCILIFRQIERVCFPA
uniref:B2 protein n=1 Tax=Rhizophora mucronata TaxID=61149 RepID=A0A2P2P3N3_RHIMU